MLPEAIILTDEESYLKEFIAQHVDQSNKNEVQNLYSLLDYNSAGFYIIVVTFLLVFIFSTYCNIILNIFLVCKKVIFDYPKYLEDIE